MTHGASFPASSDSSVWSKILLDVILAMLTQAVDKYTGVISKVTDKKQKDEL